jgi:flagellar basal-body rod protein FlgB
MKSVLFELISARTRWLAQREAVLTRNVANADTPDYRPLDLKPASFRDLLARRASAGAGGVELARTQPAHAAGAPARQAEARARRDQPFEVAPAGNAVVLDQQLGHLAETQLSFELATSLYRRQVGLLKTALGAPQS